MVILIGMGVSNFGKGSVMLILKSCWCSVVKILIPNNQVFYEQSAHYLKKKNKVLIILKNQYIKWQNHKVQFIILVLFR